MFTALILLIAMGLSWVPIGAVVGHIERRGYNLTIYQIFSCAACVMVGLAGWATSSESLLPDANCPATTRILVVCGLLALRERIDLRQAVGAVLGVAGILLGCIR